MSDDFNKTRLYADIEYLKETLTCKEEKISELRQEIYALQVELAGTAAQKDAEIAELKGITPEFPPIPPYLNSSKCRYGIKWNGPTSPLAVPMDDGYWIPFHVAKSKMDDLEKESEARLQEAKIQACELDTQKGIVRRLCDIFSLRVHDFHCESKVKEALEKRDLEQQAKGVEKLKENINTFKAFPTTKSIARDCYTVEEVDWFLSNLRQQAKALEGEK